jgi:hypothetical protein
VVQLRPQASETLSIFCATQWKTPVQAAKRFWLAKVLRQGTTSELAEKLVSATDLRQGTASAVPLRPLPFVIPSGL